MRWMEKFKRSVEANKNKIAVSDNYGNSFTFQELDNISGKFYRYFKEHNIGKETFVAIYLPRGIESVAVTLGIWKAGAAAVNIEIGQNKERNDYILSSCPYKLKVNKDLYNEILELDYMEGYEDTDPKDTLYAVYTSGTTGKPKGALLDYGCNDEALESMVCDGNPMFVPEDKFGYISPQTITFYYVLLASTLLIGIEFVVMSYDVYKTGNKFYETFDEFGITTSFITPSLFRLLDKFPDCVRALFVAGETAKNIYFDDVLLYNIYSQIEIGIVTTSFLFDKAYPLTPIGKAVSSKSKLKIIDENGNEVPDSEVGELVLDAYHFKGYLDLKEKTEYALRDGVYHTGDLAVKQNDGNYLLKGRMDNLIMIRGNRIEPAEIEGAAREILGLKSVIAKAFTDIEPPFICLYYLNKEAEKSCPEIMASDFDIRSLNEKLIKKIPEYMLPAYYVGKESFPMSSGGKTLVRLLEPPEIRQIKSDEKMTNLEQIISSAMAEALNLDFVNLDSDFYQIGGDSISAVQTVSSSNLPNLTINYIFKFRTPRKIASEYEKDFLNTTDIDKQNDEEAKKDHIITLEQQSLIDSQEYCDYPYTWNNYSLYKLYNFVEPYRLADAINKCLKHHRAFLTKFKKDKNGQILQYYDEDSFKPVEVVKISQEDLEDLKFNLVQNFELYNSYLYRAIIFVTETNKYLFMDVHHLITDGTSFKIFSNNVYQSYICTKREIAKDYYYLTLRDYEKYQKSDDYKNAEKYYKKFDLKDYSIIPKYDNLPASTENGYFEFTITELIDKCQSTNLYKKLGYNALFSLIEVLTVAKYNNSKKALVSWAMNGRDSGIKKNSCGALFKSLSLILDFTKFNKTSELIDEVLNQIRFGTANNSYEFVFKNKYCLETEPVFFLYQDDIYEVNSLYNLVKSVEELPPKKKGSGSDLMIQIIRVFDEYYYTMDYCKGLYKEESIKKMYSMFRDITNKIVEYDDSEDLIDKILLDN